MEKGENGPFRELLSEKYRTIVINKNNNGSISQKNIPNYYSLLKN